MKTLVIGYGSIGKRHSRLLTELGCEVRVLTISQHGQNIGYKTYNSLESAFSDYSPEYLIIANETAQHFLTINDLIKINYQGIVLVEKPLFNNNSPIPNHSFQKLFIAYNLRFHPLIQILKDILIYEKMISANVYVGQYLPSWRPDIDYSLSYSANKHKGGGVLRDLSHELDYINWLMEGWLTLTAHGGKFSSLEIDSDDIFSILLTTKKCPIVHLEMNYLDKCPQRFLIINTNSKTIKLDLIENSLSINNKLIKQVKIDRDYTYLKQHQAIINQDYSMFCHQDQGKEIMVMIEAIEKANIEKIWIKR